MYAAGKIPGSFFRREGRAGEKAHADRAHDRPAAAPALPQGLDARDPARVDPHVGGPRAPLRHPRDERRQRRADGVRHPLPGARRRRSHRQGRGGQLPRQPRRGVAARVPARPGRRGHRGGHPDGRGRRQRGHRGRDPRRARHRPPGDQGALPGPARPAQAGRQGEGRGHAAAGGRGDPRARSRSRFGGALDEATQVEDKLERQDATKRVEEEVLEALGETAETDEPRVVAGARPSSSRSTSSRRTSSASASPWTRSGPTAAPPDEMRDDLDRGRRRPAHARLGDLHARPDAGLLGRRARHHA